MHIDDKQLANVGMALAHYSQYLNDHKPTDPMMIELWELTRREVWNMRDEIGHYYHSLESSAQLPKFTGVSRD